MDVKQVRTTSLEETFQSDSGNNTSFDVMEGHFLQITSVTSSPTITLTNVEVGHRYELMLHKTAGLVSDVISIVATDPALGSVNSIYITDPLVGASTTYTFTNGNQSYLLRGVVVVGNTGNKYILWTIAFSIVL
jgi:hypothetical protein